MNTSDPAPCGFCFGYGHVHSPNRNGDPFDEGRPCPECLKEPPPGTLESEARAGQSGRTGCCSQPSPLLTGRGSKAL